MNETARTFLRTAGRAVVVDSEVAGLRAAVVAATGSSWVDKCPPHPSPDISLTLERSRRRFDTTGFEPVTRGVWVGPDGDTVVDSVGGSGFTQLWSCDGEHLRVRTRWTPSAAEAAASSLLPARARALQAQVLLHYPALWWAGVHGEAPLHVSLVELDGVGVLLAGPGGVGKSTLVARELESGATATCDNLAVTDGVAVHGVFEPLRVSPGKDARTAGPRTTHGRREQVWHGRVPTLTPDLVVVVKRGAEGEPHVRPITSEEARRALVAGTYAAGELQRFWPLSAVLAMATGRGPATPRVDEVAAAMATRLPCFELQLGRQPGRSLRSLLSGQLGPIYSQGAVR